MIETSTARQDKFGFYQAGPLKTYSKFEAIEYADKHNHLVHWNFNEAVFGSVNWSKEPEQSLEELYRQRAQQLREQYDYLVLWFSGGADSQNILNSFIHNNIKLDEVASYVNYDATGDRNDHLNAEIFHVVLPEVELVRQRQPWLRHTIIDMAELTVDYFADTEAKFDWIYRVNGYVNPNNAARRDIRLKAPHWRQMFNAGKRVAFIYGIDKPRVSRLNDKFYLKFADMIDAAVSAECQMLDRPWEFNELFYWTPDHPLMVVKQGHVIKNYLKNATSNTPFIVNRQCRDSNEVLVSNVTTTINKHIHWLSTAGLHTLIYPRWKPALHQYKPRSLIFTPRDSWFFNLPDSDPAKYAWKIGLERRWQATPSRLRQDSLAKGFKIIPSKLYDLGT